MTQKKREIPSSIEADDMVIGSILLDSGCIKGVMDIVAPRDFLRDQNQIIYKAMLSVVESGDEVNEITIGLELQKQNASFITPALSHIASVTPTSALATGYAKMVKSCSLYRQLLFTSEQIADIAYEQPSNFVSALDRCEYLLQDLKLKSTVESRRLIITRPRLVQTNPPRYIWNVNGKDIRLTLTEITVWGKFKNRVISELDFVPIRPKSWDDVINDLISHSYPIEAPLDASEEQQLKIFIQRWFERMREANEFSDLAVGRHIIKEVRGQDYYFFKSTPILNHLKKEFRRTFTSEDLWVHCDKWGGIKHKIRVKTPAGSVPVDLWGLPIDFVEAQKEEAAAMPDWF